MQEGDTTFIRFNATEAGSKIAVLSLLVAAGSGPFGFKIRTNGVSHIRLRWIRSLHPSGYEGGVEIYVPSRVFWRYCSI